VPVAEEVIVASGVDFHMGGDRTFYMPSLDFVQVPPQPRAVQFSQLKRNLVRA
jgi:antirestriction protein ArdC